MPKLLNYLFSLLILVAICTSYAEGVPAQPDAGAKTGNCGLAGSIVDRVKDCSSILAPVPDTFERGRIKNLPGKRVFGDFQWTLVTASLGIQLWRDDSTNKIWSGSAGYYGYHEAIRPHETDPAKRELVCMNNNIQDRIGNASVSARGGLTSENWGIPSPFEWKTANIHGVNYVLPDMKDIAASGSEFTTGNDRIFWASEEVGDTQAWGYDFAQENYHGITYWFSQISGARVLCVTK